MISAPFTYSLATARADEVSKKIKLPHFFKKKMRLLAAQATNLKENMLTTYAKNYFVAAGFSKICRHNVAELDKYSKASPEEQINKYSELLNHTGNMPNLVMINAIEYASYKTHRKEARAIKKIVETN